MFIIFIVLYIICLYVEWKVLEKEQISLSNKENMLIFFLIPFTLPLALSALIFGIYVIIDIIVRQQRDLLEGIGYFITFVLASLAYIVYYVKKRIYAFIPSESKLFMYEKKIYIKLKSYRLVDVVPFRLLDT